MKNIFTSLSAVALLGFGSVATAASIDFASVADASSSTTVYGLAGGERGASSFTFSSFGVPSLTAYGSIIGNSNESNEHHDDEDDDERDAQVFAYLDRGNAGLGVCQNLTNSNQCSPSSDDNVTYRELLTLEFETEVSLNDVVFVNGSHGTNFTGEFELSVDGVFIDTFDLTNLFAVDRIGTTFAFYNPNVNGDSHSSNGDQFYINQLSFNDRSISSVPVPAAVWLFGSGLIGLVGVARRKKV